MNILNLNEILSPVWWLVGPPLLTILIPVFVNAWFKYYGAKDFFRGKVVLITGASSGLGEALCHALYLNGCKLIMAARRVDELERVQKDLLALNCRNETFTPHILELDVADVKSLGEKAKIALTIHGVVDILINNAGISFRGSAADSSHDTLMRVMMVNYFGPICLTQALLPSMKEQKKGHIVMVSSVQGRIALPYRCAYAASKHALQAYSDCLRAEVGSDGIKVSVISPGYINTGLSANALTNSGEIYGVTDPTTSSGYSSKEVALKVISSIKFEENESIVAPVAPKVAILLRTLCPALYFLLMKRRALKKD